MNFSWYNDTASIPTRFSTDLGYDASVSGHSQELPDFSLDQCGVHSDRGLGVISGSIQKYPNEVEAVIKYGSLNSCRNRKVRSHSSSQLNKRVLEDPLLYSSDKSTPPVSRDADIKLAPGKTVWVKAVRNGWLPADRSEEWSKNALEEFKDAQKQVQSKYENVSLKPQNSCTDEMQSPTKADNSPDASKTSVSTTSNGKDDNDKEEGRGKRQRRSKIHFDEMAIPDNPARKLRRLKIMRLLGLAAPVGSPFSHTHRSS